jgi:hypothetical protein
MASKIPTPQQCLQVVDQEEVRKVEEIETKIAAEVRKQYTHYGATVSVSVGLVNQRIADEVQRRCSSSGWSATYKHAGGYDDGCAGRNSSAGSTTFTIKKREESYGFSGRD